MEMLYHSVSDLVRLANEHQIPLWKVVLLADVQERQVTVEESFETMRQMYQAMRQADQEYDGSIVSASVPKSPLLSDLKRKYSVLQWNG